jgi:hypothetical protein
MIGPLHIEVALAVGYAGFLHSGGGRTGMVRPSLASAFGTIPHGWLQISRHLDVWECPCGHHLHPHYRDPVREVVRYRAPAHTCNACARKNDCTDSEHGREIIHSSESWIETQAGKFHRVLSLTLLFLAALILIAEMFRHPTLPEVLLPGSVLALVLTRGLRLARELPARQNRDGSESVALYSAAEDCTEEEWCG